MFRTKYKYNSIIGQKSNRCTSRREVQSLLVPVLVLQYLYCTSIRYGPVYLYEYRYTDESDCLPVLYCGVNLLPVYSIHKCGIRVLYTVYSAVSILTVRGTVLRDWEYLYSTRILIRSYVPVYTYPVLTV